MTLDRKSVAQASQASFVVMLLLTLVSCLVAGLLRTGPAVTVSVVSMIGLVIAYAVSEYISPSPPPQTSYFSRAELTFLWPWWILVLGVTFGTTIVGFPHWRFRLACLLVGMIVHVGFLKIARRQKEVL